MYEHLKMVKRLGPLELLAKQLQRESHLQDATLSTSKFGRKVAIAVADEHQKISKWRYKARQIFSLKRCLDIAGGE